MKYTFNDTRTQLIVSADEIDRANLREMGQEIHQDKTMCEFFDPIVCNSELNWIDAANTGDLTSAPMVGILSEPEFKRHNLKTVQDHRNIIASCDTYGLMVCHVTERWAFMDYQARSVLEDLRDKGEVIFTGGKLNL